MKYSGSVVYRADEFGGGQWMRDKILGVALEKLYGLWHGNVFFSRSFCWVE